MKYHSMRLHKGSNWLSEPSNFWPIASFCFTPALTMYSVWCSMFNRNDYSIIPTGSPFWVDINNKSPISSNNSISNSWPLFDPWNIVLRCNKTIKTLLSMWDRAVKLADGDSIRSHNSTKTFFAPRIESGCHANFGAMSIPRESKVGWIP